MADGTPARPGGFRPPRLGIGMTFSAALMPLLRRRPDALDVLELEPQTLWLADHAFDGPFFEYRPGIDLFAQLPGRKLVHSVGMPLGGTRTPSVDQLSLLAATARRLDSPWVSEHLSVGGTPHRAAGFLLPPLQTEEGVSTAAANIRAFREGIGRPVAVETGVAYIRRKPFEMPDGSFLARVCEAADCGILLDLHNLYCNARNGRIVLDEFLSQIPLDRVWEVHLAGGAEAEGVWLDSHSGPMPPDLRARVVEILQSLPNLGAVNFEIYDTFLERMEPTALDEIVDDLRTLWDEAGRARGDWPKLAAPPSPLPGQPSPGPADWEDGLTEAVWRDAPEQHPYAEDEASIRLYAWLARSFRGSMLARALPRTIRYMLLRDGRGANDRLQTFFTDEDPKLFTPLEAEALKRWMQAQGEADALLLALLDYDIALMRMLRDGQPTVVRFPGNPVPVFEALAETRLPDTPPPPVYEIELQPDMAGPGDFAASAMGS